jgi:Uroporphyrinogen decarboxylase (URO-D)
MADALTPLQMVQGLLQGSAPPRPLFLPIVFSHGARVENLPLRSFLTNATKISNAARQIRAHLRADGVTCYFDPLLEAEALGGVLQWGAEGQPASLRWARAVKGEVPEGLRAPEDVAKGGRVGVALDVIRRLKAMLRDSCLLMAGITGPFTLAAQLAQLDGAAPLRHEDFPASALDLAAAVTSPLATALVEAGASVVFLREDVLPVLTADEAADWASRLAPAINIIRFYQALPVLLLTRKESVAANAEVMSSQPWDCVVCPALEGMAADGPGAYAGLGAAKLGVALPAQAFDSGAPGGAADLGEPLRRAMAEWHPAVVTTAGDLAVGADVERLHRLWENQA